MGADRERWEVRTRTNFAQVIERKRGKTTITRSKLNRFSNFFFNCGCFEKTEAVRVESEIQHTDFDKIQSSSAGKLDRRVEWTPESCSAPSKTPECIFRFEKFGNVTAKLNFFRVTPKNLFIFLKYLKVHISSNYCARHLSLGQP